MKAIRCMTLSVLTALLVWPLGGCPNAIPTQEVPFTLSQGLGDFEVTAGTPTEKSRLVTLESSGITLGRGSLEIDPSVITVTPATDGGGKIQLSQQGTSNLEVTAWVGTVDELTTVFETGDEYGPYTVTLDANHVPVSVSPGSVNLTDKTIDLLNDGQFSLGLRVVSPVTGSVSIESIIFNLGI